jgi:hypothetical protein
MFRRAACAFGAALVLSSMAPAQAHSWYPVSCCSNQDCEPVPNSGITELRGRYHVKYVSSRFGAIDHHVDSRTVLNSQDGQFHGCWRKSGGSVESICFFAPLSM